MTAVNADRRDFGAGLRSRRRCGRPECPAALRKPVGRGEGAGGGRASPGEGTGPTLGTAGAGRSCGCPAVLQSWVRIEWGADVRVPRYNFLVLQTISTMGVSKPCFLIHTSRFLVLNYPFSVRMHANQLENIRFMKCLH